MQRGSDWQYMHERGVSACMHIKQMHECVCVLQTCMCVRVYLCACKATAVARQMAAN
jgi:hypothetical protein